MFTFNTKGFKELIMSIFDIYREFYDEDSGDFLTALETNHIPSIGTIIELPYADGQFIVNKVHIVYKRNISTEMQDKFKIFVNKIT